jgi:hypothetical protein
MQAKNKVAMTTAEREYVRLVKLCPCSVCDAGGGEGAPSEAHEIEQGKWWLAVALCESCHRGALLGLHGQKRAWIIRKMSELDALEVTIRRVHALIAKGGHVYAALAVGAL